LLPAAIRAFAATSCSRDARLGTNDCRATANANASESRPERNANAHSSGIESSPSAKAAGTAQSSAACARSAPIITPRLRRRSIHPDSAMPSASPGTRRAALSADMSAALAASASTATNGSAMRVSIEPKFEIVAAATTRARSRPFAESASSKRSAQRGAVFGAERSRTVASARAGLSVCGDRASWVGLRARAARGLRRLGSGAPNTHRLQRHFSVASRAGARLARSAS
jgi:hypothetical protein